VRGRKILFADNCAILPQDTFSGECKTSVLFMKLQKRDAFYEDWIWSEAKKKLTTVFSLPHLVFPAMMICVRTVWAVAS
jgi:hypothetical protein